MALVETLMLANHVEVANGLLYIHGGGWTHHWRRPEIPGQDRQPSPLSAAISFVVPSKEADRPHPFVLAIHPPNEGEAEVVRVEGSFTVTPRPGSTEEFHRNCLGVNLSVVFPAEGRYVLSCEIPGQGRREVVFWVHDQRQGTAAEPSTGSVPGYI